MFPTAVVQKERCKFETSYQFFDDPLGNECRGDVTVFETRAAMKTGIGENQLSIQGTSYFLARIFVKFTVN
jgi:hypothetical protein